jgi:hypothetical protein
MQHVYTGVGGQTRPRDFELVVGSCIGSGAARELEAARRLTAARYGRYIVLTRMASVSDGGVYY